MIPVLGFVTWAMAGVFGLGASTVAFFSAYRRENPRPPRKVKTPAPDARRPPAPAADMPGPSPSVAYAQAVPPAEEPLYAAIATPGEPAPSPPGRAGTGRGGVRARCMLPRARVRRSPRGVSPRRDPGRHHRERARLRSRVRPRRRSCWRSRITSSFWTLKGTTLGGIICQLRLVRTSTARRSASPKRWSAA